MLSKGLGTGVILAADMRGLAPGPCVVNAHASMTRHNRNASQIARRYGARAGTDISGFGLFGHLVEMLRASHCDASLDLAAVPALAGAESLLRSGLRSSAHDANATFRRALAGGTSGGDRSSLDPARIDLLFDPQSAGGLLFGVPAEHAKDALDALREGGDSDAAIIGIAEAADASNYGLVRLA